MRVLSDLIILNEWAQLLATAMEAKIAGAYYKLLLEIAKKCPGNDRHSVRDQQSGFLKQVAAVLPVWMVLGVAHHGGAIQS
jgi:hypothetical protein